MKQMLLVLLGLLVLVSAAEAETTYFNELGLGWSTKSGYYLTNYNSISPTYLRFAVGYVYVQVPYPGHNRLILDMSGNQVEAVYAVNCSLSGACTTTTCAGALSCPSGGHGFLCSANCSSNVGIYSLDFTTGSYNFLYLETSYVENVDTDYSARTYAAGSTYTVPVLNRYFSGILGLTDMGLAVVMDGERVVTLVPEENNITPACNLAGGVQAFEAYNLNNSDVTQFSQYYYYANITAMPDLDIPYFFPEQINVSSGGTGIFSFGVSASTPAAVDCVSWYVHNPGNTTPAYPVKYNCSGGGYTYSFNTTSKPAGIYTVQAQLEDYTCNRYPTMTWYLTVSTSTGIITGSVLENVTGGWGTSVGATITAYSDGFIRGTTTTDSYGNYVLNDLPYGTYTIVGSKPDFTSDSRTVMLSGSFAPAEPLYLSKTGSSTGSLSVSVYNSVDGSQVHSYSAILEMYPSYFPVAIMNGNSVSTVFFGVTGTADTVSGNSVTFTNVPLDYFYSVYVNKTGYTAATSDAGLGWVSSSSSPSIRVDLVPDVAPTTTTSTTLPTTSGSFTVNVYDAITNAQAHSYSAVLYGFSPTYMAFASVGGNSLLSSAYGVGATVDTVSGNSVSFTSIPAGSYQVCVNLTGYSVSCSSTRSVSSGGSVTANLYLTPTNTTPISDTSLTVCTPGFGRVSVGDYKQICVVYQRNGVSISGATCTFTGLSIAPSSGSLNYWDYYSYRGTQENSVIILNTSTTGSYSVTCSAPGYTPMAVGESFTIYGGTPGTSNYSKMVWVSTPDVVQIGYTATFSAYFRDSMDGGIRGAACQACFFDWGYFNLPSCFNMGESSGGKYYFSRTFDTVGSYPYYVNCTKGGYEPASTVSVANKSISVYSSTPPTSLVTHCFNGVVDPTESDVDCGGGDCLGCQIMRKCRINSDCMTNYCGLGVCRAQDCNDGIQSGDEMGVDCGGSCNKSCACFVNWDCVSPGDTGQYSCHGVSCMRDTCAVGATSNCTSMLWADGGYPPYYTRDRYCDVADGVCVWNDSSKYSIVSFAQVFYNDSGKSVPVATCEEGTHGFTAKFSTTNTIYYYVHDVSSGSDTPLTSFGSGRRIDSLLPELCEIAPGTDCAASIVEFNFAAPSGGGDVWVGRDIITCREKFKLNASSVKVSGVGSVLINSTRSMNCKYRASITDTWTNVSGAASKAIILYNVSTTEKYYFVCNSSYGEIATATYVGNDAFRLAGASWNMISVIGGAVFTGATGGTFEWVPYYIIPIGLFIILGIPTLAIFGYFAYHKIKNA
jgi:hypothetical protein